MRYKIINNRRLNVYLSEEDLKKENVKIEDVTDGSSFSVKKIRKICSVVSEIAEFDIKDKGLNIILMPIANSDLIISVCVSDVDIFVQESADVYVYEDFESLLCACFNVNGVYGVKSALYLFCKEYYLLIKAGKCLKESYLDFSAILSEYGSKSEYTDLFITEHAKAIIKDGAIEKINLHFS